MIQSVIPEMLPNVCLFVCLSVFTPSIHGFPVPSMATTDHRFQAHVQTQNFTPNYPAVQHYPLVFWRRRSIAQNFHIHTHAVVYSMFIHTQANPTHH
jgi:hypothetical protein